MVSATDTRSGAGASGYSLHTLTKEGATRAVDMAEIESTAFGNFVARSPKPR